MKTPLYLVAMRSISSGKQMVWISTSDFTTDAEVVVLDEFEFEYEIKKSDSEIEALLSAQKENEIDVLKARLKVLEEKHEA